MKESTVSSPLAVLRRWSRHKLRAMMARASTGASAANAVDPGRTAERDEADEALRQLALRALFREPPFAARDGLDDYDGDYTYFEPRGDVLTYDMLRALERVAQGDSVPDAEARAASGDPPESADTGDHPDRRS